MEVGPFSISDVEGVKELFASKNISYEILVDREEEEKIMAAYHARATPAPRASAGSLDLKIIYFEISDSDFEKVKISLEKYGIIPVSDGSYELGEE